MWTDINKAVKKMAPLPPSTCIEVGLALYKNTQMASGFKDMHNLDIFEKRAN